MLTPTFDNAVVFASELHRNQKRKGSDIPYISHLLAVAALVIEDGGSEDEAIAALLHDSIEDQGDEYPGGRAGLRREIERRFGQAVLDIVNACTDDDHYSKSALDAGHPSVWRARKQAYVDHIRQASPAARRVSCADKLHNARSLQADYRKEGEKVWSRFRTKRREDQLWYYDELIRAFRETNTGPLAETLAQVIAQIMTKNLGTVLAPR